MRYSVLVCYKKYGCPSRRCKADVEADNESEATAMAVGYVMLNNSDSSPYVKILCTKILPSVN